MRHTILGYAVLAAVWFSTLPLAVRAAEFEDKPEGDYFAKFEPRKAPPTESLVLRAGDRLAICGDSITEQKMYSRIMETYLAVAVPELKIEVRQFGWSGETAPGFLGRMTNDCLRFKPMVATTCYGMNDHGYRPYDDEIGKRYREASLGIIKAFKAAGVRVVQGSPGCVGRNPQWIPEFKNLPSEVLNLNLCKLRNIGIDLALAENTSYADVFWPMFTADFAAKKSHGDTFALCGKDGVHPGWAGHLVMAYAFLKGLGLEGDIGTWVVDLKSKEAGVSQGHDLVSYKDGDLTIISRRYPFCTPAGEITDDNQLRAGMAVVPFNSELNRLLLIVKNGDAAKYRVTWGVEKHEYTAEELAKGVNLAEDFVNNPFSEAFAVVDKAVAVKQEYETRQIKDLFHGREGQADMEATVALTEKARKPLAEAVQKAFVPVKHTLKIEAL